MSNQLYIAEDLVEKVNLLQISKLELAKKLRNSDLKLSLLQAINIAGMIQKVYKLGEIRGKALRVSH